MYVYFWARTLSVHCYDSSHTEWLALLFQCPACVDKLSGKIPSRPRDLKGPA